MARTPLQGKVLKLNKMSRGETSSSKKKVEPKIRPTSNNQNGKGDSPRNISDRFKDNYDKIDWGSKKQKKT